MVFGEWIRGFKNNCRETSKEIIVFLQDKYDGS